MIIGHVSGLTTWLKKDFISSFSNSKYYIVDLDDYTDEIMRDVNMVSLVEKYDNAILKSKDSRTSKEQVKTLLAKSREINLKINEFWKKRMEFYLNELANDNPKNTIIIGNINFFRNIRIILNIDIGIKLFCDIDIELYTREIVETNIDLYRDEIVNGTFNLEMLSHAFLVKRRSLVQEIYMKKGYELKPFDQIVNQFTNSLQDSEVPSILYYASEFKYKGKIPLPKITAYVDEWVAIASALGGRQVTKGYVENDYNKPFIQELEPNVIEKFKKKIYMYVITNTVLFVPVYTKNYIYKYSINKPAQIQKCVEINDAHAKMKKLGISFFHHKQSKE